MEYTWWLIIYVVLWPLFKSTWRGWKEQKFLAENKTKGTLLELKIPRLIEKSPQAMEQFLAAIHQLRTGPVNVKDWWVSGEVPKWFSLEMVSLGGQVHFYMRVPEAKIKSLIIAAFYAFYPDVELMEVEDYMNRLPSSMREMHAEGYDLWGSEFILSNNSAYPIKTYHDFESPAEEKEFDPISGLIEYLAQVEQEQIVVIQIHIAPVGDELVKQAGPIIQKIRVSQQGGGGSKKPGTFQSLTFPGGILPAGPQIAEKPQQGPIFMMRTPGETETLEAVEANLSKPAFETVIRFAYFSPEPRFNGGFIRGGIRTVFNQYAASDLNSFGFNFDVATQADLWYPPFVFPNTRTEYRKARMLHSLRNRTMYNGTFIYKLISSYLYNWNNATKSFYMTTQCLATIFHPPTKAVLTGPHMEHSSSRKVGPPAGLAIFGDETDIERFK